MADLSFAGTVVPPGTVQSLELPFARLPTGNPMPVPMLVAHGAGGGPVLFLTAAIHGDEVNGVEIIRQVFDMLDPTALAGAVVAVPVVNVFGFVAGSRYLPDRRDLNRSFPGSKTGSLAGRLADLLMREVVARADYGIDLHTGSDHRSNLPHIRADLERPETLRIAEAFGTPLLINARIREGSLRQAAEKAGVPCLLYEAGEAQRLNRRSVRDGVAGVLRVMHTLGMVDAAVPSDITPQQVRRTTWLRARRAGLFRLTVQLGDTVSAGEELGRIRDAFGEVGAIVKASHDSVVLGVARNPIVNRGDGIIHLAMPDG
jgi:predicted deacylase